MEIPVHHNLIGIVSLQTSYYNDSSSSYRTTKQTYFAVYKLTILYKLHYEMKILDEKLPIVLQISFYLCIYEISVVIILVYLFYNCK